MGVSSQKLPGGYRALRRAVNNLDDAQDDKELTEEQRLRAHALYKEAWELLDEIDRATNERRFDDA